jgi:hypothetical protein
MKTKSTTNGFNNSVEWEWEEEVLNYETEEWEEVSKSATVYVNVTFDSGFRLPLSYAGDPDNINVEIVEVEGDELNADEIEKIEQYFADNHCFDEEDEEDYCFEEDF